MRFVQIRDRVETDAAAAGQVDSSAPLESGSIRIPIRMDRAAGDIRAQWESDAAGMRGQTDSLRMEARKWLVRMFPQMMIME